MCNQIYKLTLLFLLLLPMTRTPAGEVASYHILKGPLHKGGRAQVEITEKTRKKFIARMTYQIKKRALVPVPSKALQGETVIDLPPDFAGRRGYNKLQKMGQIEVEKAILQFIKRTPWRDKSDAYEVLILPKNGKSKIEVTYHPSLPAAGWGKVVVTFISPYPVLNGYSAVIELD